MDTAALANAIRAYNFQPHPQGGITAILPTWENAELIASRMYRDHFVHVEKGTRLSTRLEDTEEGQVALTFRFKPEPPELAAALA